MNVEDYGWGGERVNTFDVLGEEILSILGRLNPRRILDLGSGDGRLVGELQSRDWSVVGVEVDARGVEMARQANPDATFYQYGVQDDPRKLLCEEEPFDVVLSMEVIEHLFLPRQLLEYAAAVMSKPGYLVLSTPYHGYLKNLALAVSGHWDQHHHPWDDGGHIKFWSRASLTRVLEECGYRVVRFSGVGRAPFLWKSMILIAERVET